jgi:glucose/arabinose dehydrogenase
MTADPRRSWPARATAALASITIAAALGFTLAAPASAASQRLLTARFPAAMAALPNGGLVYGELETGRIWSVSAKGKRARLPLARVLVSTNGLKGLLGLAVRRQGVFAAFTSSKEHRLLVEQVAPGRARVVWRGPATAGEANGGRIAFAKDGRLLVSLGDRDRSVRPDAQGNPIVPPWPGFSGRIISLDPAGVSSQAPVELARGWFNPFSLAVTPSGAVWVADNSIGDDEHLARADLGPQPASAIKLPHMAPAGMVATSDTDLYLCGFVSRRLDHYVVGADGLPVRRPNPIVRDCSVGVIALRDGRLAYATETQIRVVRP